MDLYQLKYFLEVARELSFTRAARNLHISAPAVFRSIALLENSINKKLLSRANRRLALTMDGEFLKGQAEKIYDDIERTRLRLTEKAVNAPAALKIGSREMITNYLLPRPLADFQRRNPHTRFGIYELEPKEMIDSLKKDQIDFGLYYADIIDPGIESRRLGTLRSHIYASKKMFPGRRPPKNLAGVLKLPFIAPRPLGADPTTPSADGFPDHRHPRNIKYEGEFLETHRAFVLTGIALAVLPDLVILPELKQGKVIQLKGPSLFREIYFFKRRLRPLPQAVNSLCASLQKMIRTHGS